MARKMVKDLYTDEADIINDFVGILEGKGYEAEAITNMDGSPAVIVHLKDDDNNNVKYYCAFDYGEEE